jgi:MFS family permease
MGAASWSDFASVRYGAPAAMFTLGIALHAFNAFIASTTMPSAAAALQAVSLLNWATSAYLVGSIVGGAVAARLKAQFGSRLVLMGSSLAFIAGTSAFGLAETSSLLIAGRLLQGAGGGVVMACCYMLIPETFPKALAPRIFALESVAWALAALGGPAIAGAVTEVSSWRTAVLLSVPPSLGFLLLAFHCAPRQADANGGGGRIPLPQLILVAAGVFLMSLKGAKFLSALALVAALAMLCAAIVLDKRSASRLFPSQAFELRHPVGAGLLLVFLMSLAEAPSVVYAAFAGQKVWALGVAESGFLAATVAILWSATAIVVAHLPRLRTSFYVTPAPLILAAGLALHTAALGAGLLAAAIAGQILIGAGFGLCWARLCERIMETAPTSERDFAVGALPTIQFAGLSIGAALCGSAASWLGLAADHPPSELSGALVPVFGAAALLAAATTWVARRAV